MIVDFPDGDVPGLPTSLMRQADGKFVITGHRRTGVGATVAVVRTMSDGALDATFGIDGVVDVLAADIHSEPGPDMGSWGGSAVLQADGRIVVAGTVARIEPDPWEGSAYFTNGFILRLDRDGSLDPAFGTRGILAGSAADFPSVTTQSDGKIVVAFSDYGDMGLMRFNPDGSVDESFGVDGTSIADFGSTDRQLLYVAEALIRQADGKFVVVGAHAVANTNLGWYPAMARFGADDAGFAGLIGLRDAAGFALESDGSLVFTVRRTGGSTGAVSVSFETADGTAIAGSDYLVQRGRLDWSDGDTTDKTITLALIDDTNDEPAAAEQFGLRLGDPTGGVTLTVSVATISIEDNENDPPTTSPPTSPPLPSNPSQGGGGGSSDGFVLGLLLLGLGRSARKCARLTLVHPSMSQL